MDIERFANRITNPITFEHSKSIEQNREEVRIANNKI